MTKMQTKHTDITKNKTLLSIVMPVYNEERYLKEVLGRITAAPLPYMVEREIIVVNDGSIDHTAEILQDLAGQGIIEVFNLDSNSGKGTAVRMGIKKTKGDIIIIQDGDLEYDPDEYSKVIQPILDGEVEVVYGSRFMGHIKNMNFFSRIASTMLNLLASFLYGKKITDQFTAYKAFKADLIKSLDLKSCGFEFCSEVTNKLLKKGIRIKEVPISYCGRTFKEGKKCNGWIVFFAALYYMFHHRFILGEEVL